MKQAGAEEYESATLTLTGSLWPVARDVAMIRNVILMVLGSALLAVATKVQVPFYPVPITLATLVVLLIGGAYGFRLGAATLALYLAEGLLLNVPVFAGPERRSRLS